MYGQSTRKSLTDVLYIILLLLRRLLHPIVCASGDRWSRCMKFWWQTTRPSAQCVGRSRRQRGGFLSERKIVFDQNTLGSRRVVYSPCAVPCNIYILLSINNNNNCQPRIIIVSYMILYWYRVFPGGIGGVCII